jgi:hypothetical protein
VPASGGDADGLFAGRRRLWLAVAGVLLAAVVAAAMLRGGDDQTTQARVVETKEILGTPGNDRLTGGPGADAIFAFGGEDRVDAGGGDDLVDGGNREDVIDAGPGDDRVRAYDGFRDIVLCGQGYDVAYVDPADVLSGCEERREYPDRSLPATPRPAAGSVPQAPNAPGNFPVRGTIVLEDQPWICREQVDLELVKVTMRKMVDDAIRIDQNCSGRVERLEVDTWTADGIKVQNRGTVAHDLVIESGYVKCHDVFGEYHQDGIHVMGGHRLTFRNLAVDCLGNANLFLSRGGSQASTPTDVICDGCVLGPSSASTLFWATSLRSGARDTTICAGRYRTVRIEPGAEDRIDVNNTILPRGHPSCAKVTGGGRGS